MPPVDDLERLEKLAREASLEEGGWWSADFLDTLIDNDDAALFSYADAVFIEALKPSTALSLLAELRAARKVAELVMTELTVKRDGRLYFRTANGVPMEMATGQRRRLSAALDEYAKVREGGQG